MLIHLTAQYKKACYTITHFPFATFRGQSIPDNMFRHLYQKDPPRMGWIFYWRITAVETCGEQQSTGLLHLSVRIPHHTKKEERASALSSFYGGDGGIRTHVGSLPN